MVKFEKTRPNEEQLKAMGVYNWSIWNKEVSEFPWEYDSKEVFLVLEGKATVTSGDESISFEKGDLVTMYPGIKCTWKISEKIKKHYHFGEL